MNIKPASTWTSKWKESRTRVPKAYQEGVANNTDWQEKAISGQKLYEEQMANPDVLKRREQGLRNTDQSAWKQGAATKGAQRIAAGMEAGESKYSQAASKSQSALAGVTLPDKTSDVDANIANRVGAVAHTLRRAWGKE